jgi:hypothetical protein
VPASPELKKIAACSQQGVIWMSTNCQDAPPHGSML